MTIRSWYMAAGVAVVMLCVAAAADAHDLFLRPRDFVVPPGSTVDVRVLNGTFTTSEAAVAPDRVRELSLAGPSGRGTWYVNFIYIRAVPPSSGDSIDYESSWATLTFARP